MPEHPEFIFVEGEKRPNFVTSDAYLMAVLWFGEPGTRDGCINFICDSHFGLRQFRKIFAHVASGKAKKPFTTRFLKTPELTTFVTSFPDKDCSPKLADRLNVFPSDVPDLMSLEYARESTLELHIGQDRANSFGERLDAFDDAYDRVREVFMTVETDIMGPIPKRGNASASLFFVAAVWPGLHKTPLDALRYDLNQIFERYRPGVNDAAERTKRSPR